MTRTAIIPLIEDITWLVASSSRQEVYKSAVAILDRQIESHLVKFATATDDMLTPVISTEGGNTGKANAVPIATSIPGCVYSSGNGSIIDDLLDVRGAATVQQGDSTDGHAYRPNEHRSMLCVPVGSDGVLVALHRSPSAFDETDLTLATAIAQLTDHVASARIHEDIPDQNTPKDLLQEISRIVSHDISNKVNLAKGHLELAVETDDEIHFDRVNDALDGIQSISDIVVTLSQSGQVIDELVPVDLWGTAETVFDQLDSLGAVLTIESTNTLYADENCLRRILDNVFRNAMEHSPESVRISVGVLDDGFFIADDGPGISEEIRQQVFESGFTTEPKNDGSGLRIVKSFTEAHGWEVTITESHARGTRVEFTGVEFAG